ncbi:MAG: hypothetical protein ACSHYB_17870 [Roseibacillus sp.]
MKTLKWVTPVVLLLIVLAFLLMRNGPDKRSDAKVNVLKLGEVEGIRLIENNEWSGDRVMGGSFEQKIRSMLRSKQREIPFEMEQHHFEDSKGEFFIQIWDSEGEIFEVTVRSKPSPSEPTEETMTLLKEMFSGADFEMGT